MPFESSFIKLAAILHAQIKTPYIAASAGATSAAIVLSTLIKIAAVAAPTKEELRTSSVLHGRIGVIRFTRKKTNGLISKPHETLFP
jgi:hypothetical protein